MAALVVPTQKNIPDQQIRILLDGQVYQLRFRWNFRMASWFVDILDSAANELLLGCRVLSGTPPTLQFHHLEIPPGNFLPFDTSNRNVDPTLEDFGVRVLMAYLEANA